MNLQLYKNGNIKCLDLKGKLSIIAINEDYIILKEGGYTSYVDRVSHSKYSPTQIYYGEINKIINYNDFIELQINILWNPEASKNRVQDFIDFVTERYEEEKYDPLSCYNEIERNQMIEIIKNQRETEKRMLKNHE